MKNKMLSAVATAVALFTLTGATVFAATPSSSAELSSAPTEAKTLAQQSDQKIVYHEPGYYTVGKTVFIDLRTYKHDGIHYNQDQIYSDSSNAFTKTSTQVSGGKIVLFGSNPPSDTAVWNWANGKYASTFSMKYRVFTGSRFTGYTSYYTHVDVSNDGYRLTAGAFTITAIQDDNGEGASWSGDAGTYSADIVFTGCQAYERLAFAVSKPDDGGTDTGHITVDNH